MNQYEKYLQDKLNDAEEKIEHLYYQISITMANNASMTVMNADLYTKCLKLKEENKALQSDLHNSECNLQRMTDLVAQLKEALTNLVNLRKYKDKHGKDIYYTEYREKHWNIAEELLKESEGE